MTPFLCLWSLVFAQSTATPHLVFVVADDLGYHDVSWHNADVETRALHRLAREGVVLEGSYVQPTCTPTRTAFLTGRYPFRVGRQDRILWPLTPTGVDRDLEMLPQVLNKRGYATHAIGKWHLGFCNEGFLPTRRGFQSFYGFYTGSEDYYAHTRSYKPCSHEGLDFWDGERPARGVRGVYSTDLLRRRAVEIIEGHDPSRPLFLYLAFQSPHAPLQAPEEYVERYSYVEDPNRRKYLGMVTAMDDAVGSVVDSLKKAGLWNDTVFVFTTDNGGQPLRGGNNFPLRGAKNTLWEGGTRAVAFVSSVLIPKSYVNRRLIHAVDWFPTLVHLAGGDSNGSSIDGVNQWEAIAHNKAAIRKEFVYNLRMEGDLLSGAIRVGIHKLILGDPGKPDNWIPPPRRKYRKLPRTAITKILNSMQQKKLIYLYNLQNDPTEHWDLSDKEPGIVKRILKQLIKYLETMVPPDDPLDDPTGCPSRNGTWAPGWC